MEKYILCAVLPQELKQIFLELGEKPYRAEQVLDWIYKKNVFSFSDMKNLPAVLKKRLQEVVRVISLDIKDKLISKDGTIKYLFKTEDNEFIESVFIPAKKRITICLSTQVGCAYQCLFCASGLKGLKRNLTVDEIVTQVLLIKEDNPGKEFTNVVFMGMGEPLANYDNTLKAVRILNNPQCLSLGARRITISTCGLADKILKLAKEKIQFELSVSLHAADDKLRNKIMPVNKRHNISELIKTAKQYTAITRRIITFEYVLVGMLNDSKQDAENLVKSLRRFKCKINVIIYNPIKELKYRAPSGVAIEEFIDTLKEGKLNVTVRQSRGQDINGACGQLRLVYS